MTDRDPDCLFCKIVAGELPGLCHAVTYGREEASCSA